MINAEPGGTDTIRFAEKWTLRLTFEVRTGGAHGAYTHRSELILVHHSTAILDPLSWNLFIE